MQTNVADSPAPDKGNENRVYSEFRGMIEDISRKFHTRQTTVIKSLIENTCEYRARHEIATPRYYSQQKFDKYFTIKHDFIKNKFVQNLSFALRLNGISACIATEEKSIPGVYDVLIRNEQGIITIRNEKNGKRICVELKGGASFGIDQLERYLYENDIVVLVRVLMNQVLRIRRTDIESYLNRSLLHLCNRTTLISGAGENGNLAALQKIPGPYCKGCPVGVDCQFFIQSTQSHLVSFSSKSMQEDLLAIFSNVDGCIDQATDIIIEELKSGEG